MHRLSRWCRICLPMQELQKMWGSIPGLGGSPGEGNGSTFQYSCLEKNGQRSLPGYSPWGHKESDMTEQLTHTHTHTHTHTPPLHIMILMSSFTSLCSPFCCSLWLSSLSQKIFLICVLVYLSDFLYNCDFLLSIDSYFFSVWRRPFNILFWIDFVLPYSLFLLV